MDGNSEITCTFTVNELAGLRQIIDIAVRARGLELAETGVVINRKINDFVQQAHQKSINGKEVDAGV